MIIYYFLNKQNIYGGNNDKSYAWVVLVMKGDAYVPGALVTAESIKRTGSKYDVVCMVTPDVTKRDKLAIIFNKVVEVPYISAETNKLLLNIKN